MLGPQRPSCLQDEFAEEMAKRAAAAYGAYVGMPGARQSHACTCAVLLAACHPPAGRPPASSAPNPTTLAWTHAPRMAILLPHTPSPHPLTPSSSLQPLLFCDTLLCRHAHAAPHDGR